MASSSSSRYKITWVEDVAGVKHAVKELGREKEIAVDCEGWNLSREGTLDILSIATRHQDVYLFDIAKLGALAFVSGLKRLLESDSDTKTKLMYDCRNDSDALMHLYDVKVAGVLDLQLLEITHRRNKGQKFEFLRGLKKSLDIYVEDKKIEMIKQKGVDEIEDGKKKGVNIFAARPLSADLKEYCAIDTAALFPLLKLLKKRKTDQDISIVLGGSERYANYFRSYEALPLKDFIYNPFLPLKILLFSAAPSSSTASVAFEKCKGCRKNFNKSELKMSSLALVDHAMLCRVCKKIELRARDTLAVIESLNKLE